MGGVGGLSAGCARLPACVADNFVKPLSLQTKLAFDSGSGSMLLDALARPAKMKALHSSSALAVNFFDGGVERGASPLGFVLGLGSEITSIKFEDQFPTGLTGE